MSKLGRSIEIDFEVHQLIEVERQGFDETPNSALRRLLGLESSDAELEFENPPPFETVPHAKPKVKWSRKGVEILRADQAHGGTISTAG